VAERAFRSDLYYRLNVFPIQVPALRERREDIPLLVRYFVQKFSRRQSKVVQYVPADAMDALVNYAWPGNVRELENFLERAVLLSPGKELRVATSELRPSTMNTDNSAASGRRELSCRQRLPCDAGRSGASAHFKGAAANGVANCGP